MISLTVLEFTELRGNKKELNSSASLTQCYRDTSRVGMLSATDLAILRGGDCSAIATVMLRYSTRPLRSRAAKSKLLYPGLEWDQFTALEYR
jgi:hypothetical protein